jgi:hypothetical protein
MIVLVISLVALATIVISLCLAIAADGYGIRPAPRSHHDLDEVDSWGMPTKFDALR